MIICRSNQGFRNYFLAFCLLEEFLILLHEIRLFFIVLLIGYSLLIQCNAYLDGFNFLLLILVISAIDVEIIVIICRRKYEPINNLK